MSGDVHGVGFRAATLSRARSLGVMGWVRNCEDGTVQIHAEGSESALEPLVAFLREGPPLARVGEVAVEPVPVEGHEQFAVRGISAGRFELLVDPAGGFQLRLEVDGVMRSWALVNEPSLDPALKRLAVELVPQPVPAGERHRAGGVHQAGERKSAVWDRGSYEQGGRVAWPEALERGHAVFVLHGRRLRGGFVLQRTRPAAGGERGEQTGGTGADEPARGARWLLIKRRDEHAQRDSETAGDGPDAGCESG